MVGLNDTPPEDAGPQVDRAEELQEIWQCQPGQIWQIESKANPGHYHRLICGDCRDRGTIDALTQDKPVNGVFTSPPYAMQRKYDKSEKETWDELMVSSFSGLGTVLSENAQVFVNIGIIYRENEWEEYWTDWIQFMRNDGWRRFGWYVWDQGSGLPGHWSGRLAPSHEFVFHFNKKSKTPNKIKDCKRAGDITRPTGLRRSDGSISGWSHGDAPVQEKKIPDSVIRVSRHMSRGIEVSHPAVFSTDFASEFILAYSDLLETWLDLFCGSGTTIIACEKNHRIGLGVEKSEKYCAVILERFKSTFGIEPELVK